MLQDMGLPTGMEVKTEPVKSEEDTAVAASEELNTVIRAVEQTAVSTTAASVDAPEASEVTELLTSV